MAKKKEKVNQDETTNEVAEIVPVEVIQDEVSDDVSGELAYDIPPEFIIAEDEILLEETNENVSNDIEFYVDLSGDKVTIKNSHKKLVKTKDDVRCVIIEPNETLLIQTNQRLLESITSYELVNKNTDLKIGTKQIPNAGILEVTNISSKKLEINDKSYIAMLKLKEEL